MTKLDKYRLTITALKFASNNWIEFSNYVTEQGDYDLLKCIPELEDLIQKENQPKPLSPEMELLYNVEMREINDTLNEWHVFSDYPVPKTLAEITASNIKKKYDGIETRIIPAGYSF